MSSENLTPKVGDVVYYFDPRTMKRYTATIVRLDPLVPKVREQVELLARTPKGDYITALCPHEYAPDCWQWPREFPSGATRTLVWEQWEDDYGDEYEGGSYRGGKWKSVEGGGYYLKDHPWPRNDRPSANDPTPVIDLTEEELEMLDKSVPHTIAQIGVM